MYFKVLFLVGIVLGTCYSADVEFSKLKCKGQSPPEHAQFVCEDVPGSQDVACVMSCDPGYDVEYLIAERYVCHDNGTWTTEPPFLGMYTAQWPNCIIYGPDDPVP